MSTTDTAGNIDELRFEDAVPPDIGPMDSPPPTDDVLSCQTCGKPLTYSGRGRKPKYCDEHKRSGGGSGTVATRKTGTANDKLAAQATEALVQINRLTGFGARVLGLPETSEMIMFGEDVFRTQAYEALLTDPNLCKQILSAGAVSGKFSLAIAYAMLGAQVAPVAIMELKAKQEEKRKSQEEMA